MKKVVERKRNLYEELAQSIREMALHREGKITLRTHKVPAPPPETKKRPGPEFFVAARKKFNVSRPVWAGMLRVSPRTVEKWEQGGKVSPVTATFVQLVTHFPDTIERLQSLPVHTAKRKRVARKVAS